MNKKATLQTRRTHILQSALLCFLEKGYNQTGVRDIAKKAGISLGNLYNHFPSKKSVLKEIAFQEQAELEVFLDLLAQKDDPDQILSQFITRYSAYCCHQDYVNLSLEIIGEAVRDQEIAALFLANRKDLVSGLSGLLDIGQKAGVFRSHTDHSELSEIILDTIEGHAVRSALGSVSAKNGARFMHDFLLSSVASNTSS